MAAVLLRTVLSDRDFYGTAARPRDGAGPRDPIRLGLSHVGLGAVHVETRAGALSGGGRLDLLFRARQSCFLPSAKTTGNRTHIFVSHFLQALHHQRRTAAPAAITNDWRLQIRNLFFDFEFDTAAIQVLRAFRV